MRIEEIHVYGFGQLRDVSYRFHEGLNVVEGLNEAGKTTLMAFIRGVLFGFASRRHPELRYEPAEGGKFGGMLALMDEDGALYRVERIFRQKVAGDVTVHLPDGSTAGEAFLNELFGKMNEKVFSFTETNARAAFEVASRLAQARDVKEVLEIQTQFARSQMEAYAQQAQELARIVAASAQKAQPIN